MNGVRRSPRWGLSAAVCGAAWMVSATAAAQPRGCWMCCAGAAAAEAPAQPAPTTVQAVRRADGAIEIPVNAVMNRSSLKAAEVAAAVARARADQDAMLDRVLGRPSSLEYEAVIRGGDPSFSFSELTPPGERRALDGGFPPPTATPANTTPPQRNPRSRSAVEPGIGDPGFDPFNTFNSRAQRQFSRAAMTGTGASRADAGFARAQAQFSRTATANTGATVADDGFRRAQLQFSRTAAAGMGPTRTDVGFSRAQAQFGQAARAAPTVIPH